MDSQNIPKNENPLEDSPNQLSKQGEKVLEVASQKEDSRDHASEVLFYRQSGPIPPPEILQSYDDIYPGFAEKLLDSFIEESAHRRDLERRSLGLQETELQLDKIALEQQGELLKANSKRSNWGLAAGFLIAISALGIAYGVTVKGYPWVGGIIGGGTVTSLAIVFVIGKQPEKSKEDDETQNSKPE